MNDKDRERYREEITDFRFKLVAELANPYLDTRERRRMIREKAQVEHEVPGLGRRRLSVACIEKWLSRYRQLGKAGLRPRDRRDTGVSRAMPPAEAALLLNLLQEQPELTATTALHSLQRSARIRSNPSSSSLSRLVRSAGLERSRRLQSKEQQSKLKFNFSAPLECVQADGMYTIKVLDPKGHSRYAVLLAFLDDATRRVVHASFSFSENSLAFESGVKHILAAHGRIGRLYTDHGTAFVGQQTHRILNTLGLVLVHSQVRRPQGRGKVERFFRTAREQFFSMPQTAQITDIKELDLRFHSWLESEYHRNPHRGLEGRTPIEAWMQKAHLIIPIDPTLDLEDAFLHEANRKVYRDSTVTLDGVLFEVPSDLIGERIVLRYDPHRPPERRRPLVMHKGQCVGEARVVDSYANTKVRRAEYSKDLQVDQTEETSESSATTERRPVDNSLSATRFDWQEEPPRSQQSFDTEQEPF